jgi:hypothetical protein
MMVKSEKDWAAEDDAYTLIRAESIKMDRKRMSAAKKAAKKMAEEKKKEASAAIKVAKPVKPVKKNKKINKKR